MLVVSDWLSLIVKWKLYTVIKIALGPAYGAMGKSRKEDLTQWHGVRGQERDSTTECCFFFVWFCYLFCFFWETKHFIEVSLACSKMHIFLVYTFWHIYTMKSSPQSNNEHIYRPQSFLIPLCNSFLLAPLPWQTLMCCPYTFISLPRILYKWSYIVLLFVWLLSPCIVIFRFIHVEVGINISFFFKLQNSISMYRYTTICFSIHLLMDTYVVGHYK